MCEVLWELVRGSITKVVFGRSICLVQVVNAPVAAFSWYIPLTCGSSKLGSTKRSHPEQLPRPAGYTRSGSPVLCVSPHTVSLLPSPHSPPFCPPSISSPPCPPPLPSSRPFPLSPLIFLPPFSSPFPLTLRSKKSYGQGDSNHIGGPGESVVL
ncbi:unnamed protein product [Schistocephalus solidus]|uniref:Uncharacterized protein n=1 Tax=Schistocephalus solidus TaxID=70667 RepID=A0A183SY08_SCHSO|nr:unnamed protein product [Schistocephalus solidus]